MGRRGIRQSEEGRQARLSVDRLQFLPLVPRHGAGVVQNEEVAKILNRDFVCIKVDREERPDIDHIYMTALNVMGRQGGWPLSTVSDRRGQAHRRRHLLAAGRQGDRGANGPRLQELLKALKEAHDGHKPTT